MQNLVVMPSTLDAPLGWLAVELRNCTLVKAAVALPPLSALMYELGSSKREGARGVARSSLRVVSS